MLNRCEFIGNLGADPEIRTTQNGDKVANLRLACTEKWKTKEGEKREKTEWITITIWGPLAGVAERFLNKGSKIYVAGKWSTRKWQDQQGQDRYSTECVLQGMDAKLVMLDGRSDGGNRDSDAGSYGSGYGSQGGSPAGGANDPYADEIPFLMTWQV